MFSHAAAAASRVPARTAKMSSTPAPARYLKGGGAKCLQVTNPSRPDASFQARFHTVSGLKKCRCSLNCSAQYQSLGTITIIQNHILCWSERENKPHFTYALRKICVSKVLLFSRSDVLAAWHRLAIVIVPTTVPSTVPKPGTCTS